MKLDEPSVTDLEGVFRASLRHDGGVPSSLSIEWSERLCDGVFETLHEAEDFLDVWRKEWDEPSTWGLIEWIPLNTAMQTPSALRRWVYDGHGRLLGTNSAEKAKQGEDRLFAVGDLVRVLPIAEYWDSPSVSGDYGVVLGYAKVPGEPDELCQGVAACYRLMCISKWIFCYEIGVDALALKRVKEVPTELELLQEYSRHLKGERNLPQWFIDDLWAQRVYPLNDEMCTLASLLEKNPDLFRRVD